jgi:hypothetical protein
LVNYRYYTIQVKMAACSDRSKSLLSKEWLACSGQCFSLQNNWGTVKPFPPWLNRSFVCPVKGGITKIIDKPGFE